MTMTKEEIVALFCGGAGLFTSRERRDIFMSLFREDDGLNGLTGCDRLEVFMGILSGGSDITADRLNQLIGDYQVAGLEVLEAPRVPKVPTMFLISGYWKDDETEFVDYLVTSSNMPVTGVPDETIFYYGLDEATIIGMMEDTSREDFIITNYAPVPVSTRR